jgi:hypothetical protein
LFGKLKFLEKEQSKSNFTSLVLSMGAMVSKSTPDILKKALESVNVNKIKQWTKEKIGITIQAQKKEFYKLKRAEQKWDSIEELKVA